MGTDSIIAEGMIGEVVKRLPADLSVLFLPVQTIGKSNEHLRSPGTLTLSAETLIRAWTEIGESVARAGMRKLVMVNSHGGNVEIMGIVARELRVQLPDAGGAMRMAAAWRAAGAVLGHREQFRHPWRRFRDIGDAAFRPHRVRQDKVADFVPKSIAMSRNYKQLRMTGFTSMAWIAEDNHAEGVAGEAHLATAEKGAQAAEFQALRFIELLEDVARFPLGELA